MGMYDNVRVPCPACGALMIGQSKGGDCFLREIPVHEAPACVLADMDGDTLTCHACGAAWTLRVHALYALERATVP
jgi:hypothetical protein